MSEHTKPVETKAEMYKDTMEHHRDGTGVCLVLDEHNIEVVSAEIDWPELASPTASIVAFYPESGACETIAGFEDEVAVDLREADDPLLVTVHVENVTQQSEFAFTVLRTPISLPDYPATHGATASARPTYGNNVRLDPGGLKGFVPGGVQAALPDWFIENPLGPKGF